MSEGCRINQLEKDHRLTHERFNSFLNIAKQKAFTATLYENPVSIFYTASSLAFALLKECLGIEIKQVITIKGEDGSEISCIGEPEPESYAGIKPEFYNWKYEIEKNVINITYTARTLSNDISLSQPFIDLFTGAVSEHWQTIFEFYADDKEYLIQSFHPEYGGGINSKEISAESKESIQKRIVNRLRELLQRFEEELPANYRINRSDNGEQLSQLFFLTRSRTEKKIAYFITHEDIRIIRQLANQSGLWEHLSEFVESCGWSAEKEVKQFLSELKNTPPRKQVNICLQYLERPMKSIENSILENGFQCLQANIVKAEQDFELPLPLLKQQENIIIALLVQFLDTHSNPSSPISSASEVDRKIVGSENAESTKSEHHHEQSRYTLVWPISFMQQGLFVLQISFLGCNPFTASSSGFERFVQLVHGLFRIQESAWNHLFDLYFSLLKEAFSSEYLAYIENISPSQKLSSQNFAKASFIDGQRVDRGEHLVSLLASLNQINVSLANYGFFIPNQWVVEQNEKAATSLWELQKNLEIDQLQTHLSRQEEIHLRRLNREQHRLEMIGVKPSGLIEQNARLETMYEHLCYRMGQFIRYELPIALLSIESRADYLNQRSNELIRHELSHLLTSIRTSAQKLGYSYPSSSTTGVEKHKGIDSLITNTTDDNERVNEQVRDLYHLSQLALDRLDDCISSEERVVISMSDRECGLYVGEFLAFIKRNMGALFKCPKGRFGPSCQYLFHMMGKEDYQIDVSERDFYAIWKNLWNNGRAILNDYTLDKINETERLGEAGKRKQQILDECGPYSQRFGSDHKPQPMMIILLYALQEVENKQKKNFLYMDVLDNAPELKGASIDYEVVHKPGHYGVSVLQSIIHRINQSQVSCEYFAPQQLNSNLEKYGKEQLLLAKQCAEMSLENPAHQHLLKVEGVLTRILSQPHYWTRTGVRFLMESSTHAVE